MLLFFWDLCILFSLGLMACSFLKLNFNLDLCPQLFQFQSLRPTLLVILMSSQSQNARAEYRVFLLKITKSAPQKTSLTGQTPANPNFRLVKSNLDPSQYGEYYPLAKDESIQYIQTWICPGRTDYKNYCDPPSKGL